jgi:uncharacterized membrane protein YfcA
MIGLVAGMLSGLVGVDGGIIIVPALVFFLGFSHQAAQGTSLALLLLPVGILTVLNYSNKGCINWKAVATMGIAFTVGGWIGSKLALSLPELVIKRIFALILFYTAIKMMQWDTAVFNWIKQFK